MQAPMQAPMHAIDRRLADLGIELPEPAAPLAAYVGRVVHGGIVTVSGQLPLVDGAVAVTGRLGDDVSVEDGARAARLCAINLLAQVRAACGGEWDRLDRAIRLGGFVAATAEFTEHPAVINGASQLVADALGERGAHARAAVGVASLPLGAAVEVEGTFALRG